MAVPKLRFKKFDNDWNEVKTGDIFDNVADKGYTDKTVLTIVQGKGTVPRAESGRNMIFDEASISGYKRVMQDDFIIHLRSFEGGLEKANEEGVISPAYTVLRPKDKVATQFLYDYFHTNKFINGVLAKAVEGIRDGRQISYNMFKWLKIPFPSYEEQKKIANFLTTFDKRITAQQNIVADMEEIKKGLLQKIFSQEIRFKDEKGEDYPEWEKKKFKDVFSSLDYGMNCSAKDFDGNNKYIRITDIDDSTGKYLASNIVSPDGELDDKFLVNDGDILFARTGASTGKTYLYNKSDGKLYFAGFLIRGHVIEQYNSYFIFIATFTKHYKNWLKVMSMRSGQPGVNSKEYSEYSFMCPCLEEQNKIASFLSAYDKKIEAEKKILADLQDLKKGLLQQMFV